MNNIDEIYNHLVNIGHHCSQLSQNKKTSVYSFTFFYQPHKWYEVDNQKVITTFWPANGIGENFTPKTLEEITQKFGKINK